MVFSCLVLTINGDASTNKGLPWWHSGKESACQCRRCGFNPWVRKIPWRRGNSNPLQYLWLENPKDSGAWWAIVHGVTKSQTWLSTHGHTYKQTPGSELRGWDSGSPHNASCPPDQQKCKKRGDTPRGGNGGKRRWVSVTAVGPAAAAGTS